MPTNVSTITIPVTLPMTRIPSSEKTFPNQWFFPATLKDGDSHDGVGNYNGQVNDALNEPFSAKAVPGKQICEGSSEDK